MISVNQLSVSFGGFDLFQKISFIVNPKDRIGLVGKNGAGKSTLLKVFAGQQPASEGEVVVPKSVSVGYLPQHMVTTDTRTVFEEAVSAFDEILEIERRINQLNKELSVREDYESESYAKIIEQVTELTDRFHLLGGANFHAEVEQTLMGLGFLRSDFNRLTSEFSGGWRMRIELVKILLRKPDVFLLDEPTNHLDIESIQWLEDFLKTYSGAVVLVSHDKAFLDNVTNRTVEISLGRIYDYKANYSKYLELRKERRETQIAAFKNQQKMIADTEDFIERFRYKATKSVQVQSRIKQLEKLERVEVDEEDSSALNIKFPPAPRSGTIVVEARELIKKYDLHLVLDKIDLTIERGEKVAFVGKNGEGKTTLARIIMNELKYNGGEMKLGHNVKIGYFAQNQASLLDGEATIFDTVDRIAVGDIRTRLRDILGAFMFSGDDIEKKVKVLSGGERSRLAMIRLLLEPYNLLVLDEPTNHLDLRSKEMLKQALRDFDGTLLIVSHDREFLDGLADVVYEFRNKKVKQHLGGVYAFLEKRKLETLQELEQNTSNVKKEEKGAAKEEKKEELTFEQKKEINRNITKAEKAVEVAEVRISELEEEIGKMDELMVNPANLEDGSLYEKYDLLKRSLEEEMENWEKLNEEAEEWFSRKVW